MTRRSKNTMPRGKAKTRPQNAKGHSNQTEQNRRHANKVSQDKKSHTKHATSFSFASKDSYLLYGRNSVIAALENRNRECLRLLATKKSIGFVNSLPATINVGIEEISDAQELEHFIPQDAPHQDIFLEVRPLPGCALEDLKPISGKKNLILMLDQVTDPHNVGACIRSAAAFGARALVTQDRNSPNESGVLARASAGGLEVLPWVRSANLSQALETLKSMGYWSIGLDGHTELPIKQASAGENIVLVMGSEGSGLRPLVRKNCDLIAKIPMTGDIESLNVSNAAAIALYELAG